MPTYLAPTVHDMDVYRKLFDLADVHSWTFGLRSTDDHHVIELRDQGVLIGIGEGPTVREATVQVCAELTKNGRLAR